MPKGLVEFGGRRVGLGAADAPVSLGQIWAVGIGYGRPALCVCLCVCLSVCGTALGGHEPLRIILVTSTACPRLGWRQARVPHPAGTLCPSPLSPGRPLGLAGGRQAPALPLLHLPFLPPFLFYLVPVPALSPSLPCSHPHPCLVTFPASFPIFPHPVPASSLSLPVPIPASSSPLPISILACPRPCFVPVPVSSPSLSRPHPCLLSPSLPPPTPACPLSPPQPPPAPGRRTCSPGEQRYLLRGG